MGQNGCFKPLGKMKLRTLFGFFISSCVSIYCLEATLFIDINKTKFTYAGKPKEIIRVVQFDTCTQLDESSYGTPHFIKVEYRVLQAVTHSRNPNENKWWPIKVGDVEIGAYDWCGNVRLKEAHKNYNVYVRTMGEFQNKKGLVLDLKYVREKGAMSPVNTTFEICFYEGENKNSASLKKICAENTNENSKELGALGELATNMILVDLGWQCLPSKYEDNHGFDGVYGGILGDKERKKAVYLTESKCRNEAKSAQKYHETTFTPKSIDATLGKMRGHGGELLKTEAYVRQCIQKGLVYTLVHRVHIKGVKKYPSGYVESYVEELDKDAYESTLNVKTLTKSSPQKEKTKAVEGIRKQCGMDHGELLLLYLKEETTQSGLKNLEDEKKQLLVLNLLKSLGFSSRAILDVEALIKEDLKQTVQKGQENGALK